MNGKTINYGINSFGNQEPLVRAELGVKDQMLIVYT